MAVYLPYDGRKERRRIRAKVLVACVTFVGVGAISVSVEASAAGFMIRENSVSGIGTVYAGNGSRADSPSTAFNNPAGMTRLSARGLELGATVVFPNIEFRGEAIAFGAPISGTGGGDAGPVTAIPHLYWTFALNDRLSAGIAATVPFGLGTEYDTDWFGRYLGIKTSALSADINPNIAYWLTDYLSVGGGVSAQYLKLDFSSAIAQFALFGPGTPDASYRFEADGWAVGFNLGALLELQGGMRVGLTYRSRIDHRIDGALDFAGAFPILGLANGPAAADVHLPATIGLSVTKEVDSGLSVSADVQFTQWSVFKRVTIESQNPPFVNNQEYRDTWMISVGGIYRLNDAWLVRAGAGWDQTPVTDAFRAVSLPDETRYLVGIGFSAQLTDTIFLDGAYQHSFAAAQPSMNSSANNTDPITQSVVLMGNYDIDVNIVGLSMRYKY